MSAHIQNIPLFCDYLKFSIQKYAQIIAKIYLKREKTLGGGAHSKTTFWHILIVPLLKVVLLNQSFGCK